MEKQIKSRLRVGISKGSKHEIRNSYGSQDYYRFYLKTSPKDQKYRISQKEYGQIVKMMGDLMSDQLIETGEVTFPCGTGGLYIAVNPVKLRIKDGKLAGLPPVNWDATIKLWSEDEESHIKKVLVRTENKIFSKIKFRSSDATFHNRSKFSFMVLRSLRGKMISRVKDGHNYIFKLNE